MVPYLLHLLLICTNIFLPQPWHRSQSIVVPRGLEPRTLRLLAVRSNQLSYETSGSVLRRLHPNKCPSEQTKKAFCQLRAAVRPSELLVPIRQSTGGKAIQALCSELSGLLGHLVCQYTVSADGHISPNAPDLFRPPKLSGGEPA